MRDGLGFDICTNEKPAIVHIVVTGRGAIDEYMLATFMQSLKHKHAPRIRIDRLATDADGYMSDGLFVDLTDLSDQHGVVFAQARLQGAGVGQALMGGI
ncbi:hypothetical protein AQ878_20920 [Burkholderia pseudomallei]|nr:hypothetical protein AQ878_20920 [Burkholderia pseudomallei]